MTESIERQVIELIARKKKVDPATVTSATTFEELGLDSLDAADLMFTVEDTFKVLVPDQAAMSMKTVGEVVQGVTDLVAAGPAASNAAPASPAKTAS